SSSSVTSRTVNSISSPECRAEKILGNRTRALQLWSAKIRSVVTQPPLRAHIHDASRRVRISSQPDIRQADCVGARWTAPGPTWALADRDLTSSAAFPGYNACSSPESLFADGVR